MSTMVLVSETNGTWGRAKQVLGLGTLNKGGHASVNSVSRRSAGNGAGRAVQVRAELGDLRAHSRLRTPDSAEMSALPSCIAPLCPFKLVDESLPVNN
jgi:hypothetical protein